jgi:ubiquinone/menaquinone biosynthesis C-methylase UbiE
MCFHQTRFFAWLLDLSMRDHRFVPYRERIIGAARGEVLEIGIGSGLNLPFYAAAAHVIGLDPSPRLLALAHRRAHQSARQPVVPVDLLRGSAEAIPLEDERFDMVVTTWTLCSIPDALGALREMRRVLRPNGRLLFVEHGRAPDAGVRWWQDHLTPAWKHLSGGCHLNRPIDELIEGAGFRLERLATGYMQGRNPMTFMYEGRARPC